MEPHEFALGWSLLSKHGLVVVIVAARPDITRKALAQAIGATPRHISAILRDLREADMVRIERVGRRNHYQINLDAPLRARAVRHVTLGQFMQAFRNAALSGAPMTDLGRDPAGPSAP